MAYGFDIPNPTPQAAADAMAPSQETFGDLMGLAPRGAPNSSQRVQAPAAEISPSPDMSFLTGDTQPQNLPQPMPGRPFASRKVAQEQDAREKQEQSQLLEEFGPKVSDAPTDTYDPALVDQTAEEIDQLLSVEKGGEDGQVAAPDEFRSEPESAVERAQRFAQNPGQFFKDQWNMTMARARAGLGDTDVQKARGFKGVWNDPETGAAVAFKGGKPFVKYPNSKGYVPVGGQKWDILNRFFTDNAGTILDIGVSAPISIATDTAATVAGLTGGGMPAAVGVYAGGNAAAGFAGRYAVRGAQKTMDYIFGNDQLSPEESQQFFSDALMSAGINAATSGLFLGGGKLTQGVRGAWQEAGELGKPLQRIFRLNEVKQFYSDFVEEYSQGTVGKGLYDAATSAHGAIDAAVNKLSGAIASLEGKAIALAGKDEKFLTRNTLDTMKNVLEDYGAIIDPKTGKVTLPDDAAMRRVARMQSYVAKGGEVAEADIDKQYQRLAEAQGKMKTVFGDSRNGRKELEALSSQYETFFAMNAMGGGDLKITMKMLDSFKNLADYETEHGAIPELTATYRKLHNAATQDRAMNLQRVFGGSGLPEEELFRKVYRNYTENIDSHMKLAGIFRSQKTAENFVKSIAGSTDHLMMVQKALGKESKEWFKFKGEFLGDMIQQSVDKTTGIFQGEKFLERLYRVPEAGRKVLFNPEELKTLQRAARVSQEIYTGDLLTKSQKNVITDIAALMPNSFMVTRMRGLMNMFSRNYKAMHYLSEDALQKKSLSALTRTERAQYNEAQRYLQELMGKMDVVSVNRQGKLVQTLVPKGASAALRDKAMDSMRTRSEADKKFKQAQGHGLIVQDPDEPGI